MPESPLPKVRPIAIKERLSLLFIEKGHIDVLDGAMVVIDKTGVRTHIPIGGVSCLMLEPGTRISHAAVAQASRVGCLLVWVGEAGVRLYASGQPGGAKADRLLQQARLALDEEARLKIVRRMFALRFKEEPPSRRSIEQLRAIEGLRVKKTYQLLARRYGVLWKGRNYDHTQWGSGDDANRCLSAATACLYGITEAAVLAAGYAPAIGFLHMGKPLSFVYDIADLYKFETVAPIAFRVASQKPNNPEQKVRWLCREAFRTSRLLERIIPDIGELLSAGGLSPGPEPAGVVPPAIPNPESLGDDGHRA